MAVLLYSSDLKKFFFKDKSITLFNFNKKKIDNNKFYYNDFLFNKVRKKKKFEKEFIRLKNKVLKNLIKILNLSHEGQIINELSWKVLLEPWLSNYISKNIYYWHLINFHKKGVKKYAFLPKLDFFEPPIDTAHATQLSDQSDEYNFYLLQNMCKFIFGEKKKILCKNFSLKKKSKIDLNNFYPNSKNKFLSIYNLFFFKFYKDNKIIFDINNIGIKKLLINFRFFQLPVFMNLLFSKPNYNDLLDNYKKKKINRSRFLYSYKEKSLEKYLLNNSIIDLPSCFLENFEKIMHKVSEIGLRPHIITSDGRYEFNLYFKFWVALKISQGKKFVSSDHGSCYVSNFDHMYHEECSHYSLRWFKFKSANSIQLPILQNLKKRKNDQHLRENLIIICTDLEKFPRHVLWSPIHNENLYQVKIIKDIFKGTKKKIKSNISIKLHPRVSKSKLILNTQITKYISNITKSTKVINNQKEFKKIFYNSKLNICLSPHTAFIESFLSGPTILIMNHKFYKIREEFRKLHDELLKENIIFCDGITASKHINKIWDNPEDWWCGKRVLKVRKKFENLVCKTKNTHEAIYEWSNFFKRLL